MLFDLRGRGRRRTVQAIYLSLALLMGGGLVLFGVGGATSGGLLDAFKANSGNASVDKVFQQRVDNAERAVRLRPQDPQAWANLTRVRFQQAGTGDGFDSNNQVFTDKGKAQLRQTEAAWDRYLTLTKTPDENVARIMVQAFSQGALDEPDKAVSALETVMDSQKPTGPLYVQLAALAYQAGQTRKAELASTKALQLTPKDDKEQIKAQLQAARTAASAQLDQGTGTTTTPTPASPSS
jgi:cytochrome c-type biogenesis protein CcmH/NrfG